MIVSPTVLFVHAPKMAGTSVRHWLLATLPGPFAHVRERPLDVGRSDIRHLAGNKHGDLIAARPLVQLFAGVDLPELPLILACIRNPYEREVAWFAYWAANAGTAERLYGRLWDGFEAFVNRRPTLDRVLHNFYEISGLALPNLRLVRTERLEADLRAALSEVGIAPDRPVPRLNTGSHGAWRDFYTPAIEAAVYDRYRWYFERGLYPRLSFDDDPAAAALAGPARACGPVEGLYPDGWAEADAGLTIVPLADLGRITIRAVFPDAAGADIPVLATVAGQRHATLAQGGRAFDWTIAAALPVGRPVRITLQSGRPLPADATGRRVAFRDPHVEVG